MSDIVFLYSTAPSEEVADSIAAALIAAGAAACVNIIPGMRSVYRWRGVIEQCAEVVLIIKTTAAAAPRARDLLVARHPHETPALAAISIDDAASSPAFLDWIRAETAEGAAATFS